MPGVQQSGDCRRRPVLGVGDRGRFLCRTRGTWESQGNPRVHDLAAVSGRAHRVPATVSSVISGCPHRALPEELDPAFECEVMQQGDWTWRDVSAPQLSAHRRHRPRRLQAHERRERCPLRSERGRRARAGRVDAAATRTMRFWRWIGTAMDSIDDGSELFGNHTPARPDLPDVTTPNGFEALKFVETPAYGAEPCATKSSTARDAVFSRLVLWRDVNHNGISEPDELQPVASVGPQGHQHRVQEQPPRRRYGNEFRQRSRVLWRTASTTTSSMCGCNWRD